MESNFVVKMGEDIQVVERSLTELLERVTKVETRNEVQDREMYGRGQEDGLIARVMSLERKFYILIGAVAVIHFLTDSGFISLKNLLGK